MNNLSPEQRTDKNGHLVTRHVRNDKGTATTNTRLGGIGAFSVQVPDAGPQSLEELKAMPTIQDKADAMRISMDRLSWERGWSQVMNDVPRTAANRAEYDRRQEEWIVNSPELMEQVSKMTYNNAARHSYARAYTLGIESDYDDHFEKIWRGEAEGFSEVTLNRQLREMNQLSADFDAGKISPARVIGTGIRNAKVEARTWIDKSLVDMNEALATRGRSASVNVANAEYNMRRSAQSE